MALTHAFLLLRLPVWSLLNFVNPQIFDDLSVFQSWFGFKDIGQKTNGATDEQSILMEQRQNQTITKLHEISRPFLLRRIKMDVLSEMPATHPFAQVLKSTRLGDQNDYCRANVQDDKTRA